MNIEYKYNRKIAKFLKSFKLGAERNFLAIFSPRILLYLFEK